MLKKNGYVEIEITGVVADGFGIGRVSVPAGDAGINGSVSGVSGGNDSGATGFAVFVDGALPGDRLLVRIVKIKTSYAYGKIEKILVPSLHRKNADASEICPLFSRCGGCQWQHCGYAPQLQFKKNIVRDALVRIGKAENPPVEDVLGMDEPYRYRGKAVFPIGPAVGVFAPRSHRIIPIINCNIQHPVHEKIISIVNNYIEEFRVPVYNEETHTGLLRHLMIRASFHSGEVMAALTVNGKEIPRANKLTARLTDAGVNTFVLSIHTARGNAVMGGRFKVLSGSGFINERIGHVDYRLSARSFFQVNPAQTKVLYDKAVEAAGLPQAEDGANCTARPQNENCAVPAPPAEGITVLDAHAGVGGVALYAARHAKKVYGVEIVPESVADAKRNAELNGIANAEFLTGAAETVIPKLLSGGKTFDVIFLDPPRKGCGAELTAAIIGARIKTVVYISCDPATLARDVKMLTAAGYELKSVQPVDMFPQTSKVETVVKLQL